MKFSLILRLTFCSLLCLAHLEELDNWFYDHFFKLRGSLSSSSKIVLVNLPSEEKNTEVLQITRLIQRISMDNPKAIAITFPIPGLSYSPESSIPVLFSEPLQWEKNTKSQESLNSKDSGFNDLFPSADGSVRSTSLKNENQNSLPLQLASRFSKNNFPQAKTLLINYRGPENSFLWIDAVNLMHSASSLWQPIDGKIVIIGRNLANSQTGFETPFGKMSRTEVLANITETILHSGPIYEPPTLFKKLLSFLVIVTSAYLILFFSLSTGWLLLIFFALLLTLSSIFLFCTSQIWLGLATPLMGILGAHIILLGYRLNLEEEEQWKTQKEASYAKDLDEFKNNFISLFSHELKTPLAKIQALTNRLITGYDKNSSEDLKQISLLSDELTRKIGDILKITKMESMKMELQKGAVDFNLLIESAVAKLRLLADTRQIALVLDLEPLFPISGDKILIQEVITNLIDNAIKYSPDNTKIVVRTREEKNSLILEVSDQGLGIPAEELPRVTNRFYRGKNIATDTKGSGLGLYLSKYFVELHKGLLELESKMGVGTKVTVRLPLTP
jgi:signal transduction histidine kinase